LKLQGIILLALTASLPVARAGSLFITPTFDSSITGNGNAANIESAINSAISTFETLYATPTATSLTLPVTFTYNTAAPGNLLSTNQLEYDVGYSAYKTMLQTDSTQNPLNTVLAAALANLSTGNDANGVGDMVLTAAQLSMLGDPKVGDVVINIASNQTFDFSRPVSPTDFDLIGGLEHELDEVLGGGGGGSNLNTIQQGACNQGSQLAFFCGKFGALDLLRYSGTLTPSFTTSGAATAYLSVTGGATSIVGFNQNSGGDYGDFGPSGTGPGELIQNAFNDTGQNEAYTTGSPEFAMLEAIGWNAAAGAAVPEPGTLGLLGVSFMVLALGRKRLRRN
jgi:PEP-CTERM motif-containing protein